MRQTVAAGTGEFRGLFKQPKTTWEPRRHNLQWKNHNQAARGQTAITTATWRVGYETWRVNSVSRARGKSYSILLRGMNEEPTA